MSNMTAEHTDTLRGSETFSNFQLAQETLGYGDLYVVNGVDFHHDVIEIAAIWFLALEVDSPTVCCLIALCFSGKEGDRPRQLPRTPIFTPLVALEGKPKARARVGGGGSRMIQ